MSYVNIDDNVENKILFKDFVDVLKENILGKELYNKFGTWQYIQIL